MVKRTYILELADRFGCFRPDHLLTSSMFLGTFLNLFKLRFPCLERVVNSSQHAGCLLIPNAKRNSCSYDDVRADTSAGRLKLLSLGVTPGSFQTQTEGTLQAGPQMPQGYSRLESSPNWHRGGPMNPKLPPGQPRPIGYTAHSTHSLPTRHPVDAGLGDHRLDTFSKASVAQVLCLVPFSASRVPLPLILSLSS